MKICKIHSHLNGYEWMMVHKPELIHEIHEVVKSINAEDCKTKISKEKAMRNKALYAPKELNKAFKKEFEIRNWSEKRVDYWVTDDFKLIRKSLHMDSLEQKTFFEKKGKLAYKSYNQTDFLKGNVAIEVQFGKYSFIPYDMFVKHLAFYMSDVIEVGVEIVPMKSLQAEMSSGPGYYEGSLYDMARQGRNVPAVPLVLIGIGV